MTHNWKTKNKGEWSEAYAFVKLLGDGKVNLGDEELNKLEDSFVILNVQPVANENNYAICHNENIVKIIKNDEVVKSVPCVEFEKVANISIEQIIHGNSTFPIPELEKFLLFIDNINFKSPSRSKKDLNIKLYDSYLKIPNNCSFSIKSNFKSKSTILNAGKTTNFVYQISGVDEDKFKIFNSITKKTHKKIWVKTRFNFLNRLCEKKICEINFCKAFNENFDSNLKLIDTQLPEIVASILLDYYSNPEHISSIKELTERLVDRNPLNLSENIKELGYKSKIIDLIKAAAFGMRPSEPWNNKYEVTGGFLVVTMEGDVLCLHIFYSEDSLDEYLYNNTKLDTPSTSRHEFGELRLINNDLYSFKLNLQIRFK